MTRQRLVESGAAEQKPEQSRDQVSAPDRDQTVAESGAVSQNRDESSGGLGIAAPTPEAESTPEATTSPIADEATGDSAESAGFRNSQT
jgi:hypothetical protein